MRASTLTNEQEICLSLLFVFSATLSIIGSSTIIYRVLRSRKEATPYDRLMLGLSTCDVIASFTYGLTPFLMSAQDPNHRVWAIGNTSSCTALGFFSQFSFSAVFYNCMLSYYFLLTIRFGVKREQFAERFEIPIHVFALSYFSVTATVGAIFGMYSGFDVGLGCWVHNYPKGCVETDTCTSPTIGFIFGAGPTILTFLSLLINYTIIYIYVQSNLNMNTATSKTKNLTIMGNENADIQSHDNSHIKIDENTMPTLSFDIQHKKQTKEIFIQGMLYVLTFVFSYTPAFVVRIMEAYSIAEFDDSNIYPLVVLMSFSLPLQGFFNMFVYFRPIYSRIREAYPELSILELIRAAVSGSKISDVSISSEIKSRKKKKRKQNVEEVSKENSFVNEKEILEATASITSSSVKKQKKRKQQSSWAEIGVGVSRFSLRTSWAGLGLGYSEESFDEDSF